MSEHADVCLVLEGTYPYVPGGVSSWAHELIRRLPACRFALVHIGAKRTANPRLRYALPPNVVSLSDLYCREPLRDPTQRADERRAVLRARRALPTPKTPSRMLRAIRWMHLENRPDGPWLDDIAAADLSVADLLHGAPAFELLQELAERLAPDASFVDLFWHFRSMHLPVVRLLGEPPPRAALYHSLSTGYAGLLAAAWSRRTGRPLLLTEHGIYTRERMLELTRAGWVRRARRGEGPDRATTEVLGRSWTHFFRWLASAAYEQASWIVTLSEDNRRRQIAEGAPRQKTLVIPNGVDAREIEGWLGGRRPPPRGRTLRVAFVGRVVPIKDVVTFVHACDLALRTVDLDVVVVGPLDEDPPYARRCRKLVAALGRERSIRFVGPMPMSRIYAQIDLLVLTSFSEGQPLVVLEANAAGVPVVASDVGCCRELLEGGADFDRRLGPSGIVTRIASPAQTAAAIVRLARDPVLRARMGAAGRRRVSAFYEQGTTIARYQTLYETGSWPASAGS